MPANHCLQAAEHDGWKQLREEGCANAAGTMQIELHCLHHQASLSKKPSLLAIEGLCSSMVRFTRAMRSSKFQDLFCKGLDEIAVSVDRQVVPVLSKSCEKWKLRQSRICSLLSYDSMTNDDFESLVNLFNGSWSESFEQTHSWVHYCNGCCVSKQHTAVRARELLRKLFENFPQIPLLYRWKGWEASQNYVGIGVMLHGFLSYLVKCCCDPKQAEQVGKLIDEDEDNAEFSYALRQEVRISKTLKFITGETLVVPRQAFINL